MKPLHRMLISLAALFVVTFATSKEGSVVRRAAVDAEGKVQQADAADLFDAAGTKVAIDTDGELQHAFRKSGTEDAKVEKNLQSASMHSRFVPEGDRKKCDRPFPRRNRYKLCQEKECGPPPLAYMVGLYHDHTMMESFSTQVDAGMDNYWPGNVARMELDAHMVPDKNHCVCAGCEEWMQWAIKQLSSPTKCDFPDHEWRLVFSAPEPEQSKDETVKFEVGRILAVENQVMQNMEFGMEVTRSVFRDSEDYMQLAKREGPRTWLSAHTVDTTVVLRHGKPIHIFQYILKCKLFNQLEMYVNELEFHTPHLVHKDNLDPPDCQPNQDGGFQECRKSASEENVNEEKGRNEEVLPDENEDVRNHHKHEDDDFDDEHEEHDGKMLEGVASHWSLLQYLQHR